jgi:hypothetical protein
MRLTKATGILLGLLLVATEAQAISRYSATSLSCARIQAIAEAEGAALMRWVQPPDIQRYDRIVANRRFCFAGETTVPSTVPSADTAACPVYICKHCFRERDEDTGFSTLECY